MGINDVMLGVMVVIGFIAVVAVILTLPTYYLWNWLMPIIFDLKRITLFQALGLNILCGILFGSSSKNSSK